tara:strand:+ start:3370 stop:4413 length:1044 start_codon:yes stop_codon:yes gene_type:complete
MMKKATNLISRRGALAGGAAVLAAPAFIGNASAQAKVTWKVQAHWPKASSSFSESLAIIADELKANTDGQFELQLFGAGEFAKGGEIFNIVRRGVVEMGTISPGYILGEAPSAGLAYGIPGTFREAWEFSYFLKNMGMEELFNEELAKHGVVSRAEKVYPTEIVISKPVNSIDDFAKLKLRSTGAFQKFLEAAGASTQSIAGPELYSSLASGVVDGAHWGAAQGAKSMSLWEVAKYHMKPTLGLAMDTIIINQGAIDALTPDLKKELFHLLDLRFWKRTAEYLYKEKITLADGQANMGVEVMEFPVEVQEKFKAATSTIIDEERAKGGNGAKGADMMVAYLKELGYL